jgi:Arc/MetJ family transcription regulator
MKAALRVAGARSKREAVELELKTLVQLRTQEKSARTKKARSLGKVTSMP